MRASLTPLLPGKVLIQGPGPYFMIDLRILLRPDRPVPATEDPDFVNKASLTFLRLPHSNLDVEAFIYPS